MNEIITFDIQHNNFTNNLAITSGWRRILMATYFTITMIRTYIKYKNAYNEWYSFLVMVQFNFKVKYLSMICAVIIQRAILRRTHLILNW